MKQVRELGLEAGTGFEEFFRSEVEGQVRRAALLLGSTDTANDVVQEAFILLAAEPEAPQNAAAWLYCVVLTRALNASRSARRRQRHEVATAQPADYRS